MPQTMKKTEEMTGFPLYRPEGAGLEDLQTLLTRGWELDLAAASGLDQRLEEANRLFNLNMKKLKGVVHVFAGTKKDFHLDPGVYSHDD